MPIADDAWRHELAELGRLADFDAFGDDAAGLVDALRNDVGFAADVARADTRPRLVSWFSENAEIVRGPLGWQFDSERSGPIGERSVGIEWSWQGVHDKDDGDDIGGGSFNGTAPSGRDVMVRGFTLISAEEGFGLAFKRYVDWAGLYAQLGLTVNWRTPIDDPSV